MEHEHHYGNTPNFQDAQNQWVDHHTYPHSHHQSPSHEYGGFAFSTPQIPMEPTFSNGMHPPRTTHQQLQPLVTPQWPSMLTSQSTYQQSMIQTAPASGTPLSASTSLSTPVSAPSSVPPPNSRRPSQTGSTPRKTLTDADRRRMCMYHEENPTTKQTEIGALFGVERSTVSKVLRNKEKYLFQDDGGRSPIKRSKGKFPDIERALTNWARNHQKQGLPLSDAIIREKARFFATTVGNSDSHIKLNSNSWLEKFKQKNNLMGAGSRKSSLATEDAGETSNPGSNSGTPNGISPVSASGLPSPSPISMSATKSEEDIKPESPDSFDMNSSHRPFHSQSNNSLSSVFTDTTPSSFSAGPTSPTSPFFTPDSMFTPSSFMSQPPPDAQARMPLSNSNSQRPRSQTFPTLNVDPYVSPPTTSEALTPKYLNSTALDSSALESPISEMPPTLPIDQSMPPPLQPRLSSSDQAMHPPPPPQLSTSSHHSPVGGTPGSASPASASPTQDDARRALELLMDFFQQQPSGFVEPQEFVTIGKLMQKLKLHRTSPAVQELPGGLHRIHHEREFIARPA